MSIFACVSHSPKDKFLLTICLCAVLAIASCGSGGSSTSSKAPSASGGSAGTPPPTGSTPPPTGGTPPPPPPTGITPPPPPPPPPTPPTAAVKASQVVLVVLENTDYASVVGTSDAPYLNSLLAQGALATNYYANVHPSIGNYFMLTAGNMVSTNDAYHGQVAAPELATVLTGAQKSWKVYVEGIPAAGYMGGDAGIYLRRHNPFVYFTDVAGTTAANNIVPFSQLATDATATLPNFTMIVGGRYDSGHNCLPAVVNCTTAVRVQQADAWLKAMLPQILSSPSFQASGLLAVTFDESETDGRQGGGQVATVLVGTNVKPGYRAGGAYQHQSLLRLMLEAQGITTLPNASAAAPSMAEVWK